jgi:hypothetical protein
MEQTTQPINQKPTLPIKTKIAAWLMIGGSIISLVIALFGQMFLFFEILIPLLIFLYIGFNLLKLKKWAWRGAMTSSIVVLILLGFFCFGIFSIIPGGDINYCFFYNCYLGNGVVFRDFILVTIILAITLISSLILFLLDRKNFWKIAT